MGSDDTVDIEPDGLDGGELFPRLSAIMARDPVDALGEVMQAESDEPLNRDHYLGAVVMLLGGMPIYQVPGYSEPLIVQHLQTHPDCVDRALKELDSRSDDLAAEVCAWWGKLTFSGEQSHTEY